jgi:hypothetical protein
MCEGKRERENDDSSVSTKSVRPEKWVRLPVSCVSTLSVFGWLENVDNSS